MRILMENENPEVLTSPVASSRVSSGVAVDVQPEFRSTLFSEEVLEKYIAAAEKLRKELKLISLVKTMSGVLDLVTKME